MLLRTLLLMLVVACAAPFCAAEWPCPVPSDIAPCICTFDVNHKLTMDCSEVKTSSKLATIFQTHFSFNDFLRLVITPTDASTSLQDLPADVFGPVTFEYIDISGTRIHTVEEQALANSHSTLVRLNLARNQISGFPFETLHLYTLLTDFDISYNKLSGNAPDIASDHLINLDLSGNRDLTLTETTFEKAPYIETLHLNEMHLSTTTPPHVFKKLKYLKQLHLKNNDITGELIENFINPTLNPLVTLSFNANKITQVHPLAVSGLEDTGHVSFENNNIEYLYYDNWITLVSQLSQPDAIDIRENPLVCGCDVMWLVVDSDLMRIFHKDTTCVAGIKLVELDKAWFDDHC